MFLDGTLHAPYDDNVLDQPQEDTAVEFLLNRISQLCTDGQGNKKWLTHTESGETCTVEQAESISRKVASGMFKRGMRKGDVMLYSSESNTWMSTFMLGVWRANGTMRATYVEDSIDTMSERILESKIKWILCDANKAGDALRAAEKVPWKVEVICLGNVPVPNGCVSAGEIMSDDGAALPELVLTGADTGVIFSTSGTTGAGKGALHTQRGLVNVFRNVQHITNYSDGARMLVMARPTQIGGFTLPFAGLDVGMELLLISDLRKENIFHAVHHYKPSLAFGFPKDLLYLANDPDASKYNLSSLRVILVGGVVVTPGFIDTMERNLGVQVTNAYGMTECGPLASAKNCDLNSEIQVWESNKPNLSYFALEHRDVPDFSVGKLVPGTMLQVRDIESGRPVGPNQRGELCFKNNAICAGYLNNTEETQGTFPNGWIRTGDVGYFDENGFVFVVDRIKEIFKYYNNHISPSELENLIQRHPAVNNVCVVGVPDPEGGDSIPRAFVTLKDSNASADEICQFVNDKVASYQRLRGGLFVVNELPVGKTGKFDRSVLSRMPVLDTKVIASLR